MKTGKLGKTCFEAITKLPNINQVENKLNNINLSEIQKPTKQNKGSRGFTIEKISGIPNSSRLCDMIDGEAKSFTLGESIACTSLGHCLPEIVNNTPFLETKLAIKMKQVIYVAFDRKGQFIKNIILNEELYPEHYDKLKDDYHFISKHINQVINEKKTLGTVTGPNKLLQIRTKASKKKDGTYTPLMYETHQLNNKYMAFYLCGAFGKEIINYK